MTGRGSTVFGSKKVWQEQCRPECRSAHSINVCERTDEPWRLPAEVMWSRQANAEKLTEKEAHLEATEELRQCLEDCDAAESELDDALRAHRKEVREKRWLHAGTIAVIVATLIAVAKYVLSTQQGSPPLP